MKDISYILDRDELNENDKRKNDLVKLIFSGEMVLFVGAGCSKRLGYPDWKQLIKKLEAFAKKIDSGFTINNKKRDNNPLEYVDDIKDCVREKNKEDRFYGLISKIYGNDSIKPSKFHEKLVGLQVRGILTTNYDMILEKALIRHVDYPMSVVLRSDKNNPDLSNFIKAINAKGKINKYVMHLHGIYNDIYSIVLSAKDYERVYDIFREEDASLNPLRKLHNKLLWSFFATRRVLFIGFSMDDPYLRRMLQIACLNLMNWEDCFHYALIGIPLNNTKNAKALKIKAQNLKDEFGVGVIFYGVSNDKHSELDRIIDELYEGQDQTGGIGTLKQNVQIVSKELVPDPVKGKLFLEQWKKINKRMQDPRISDEN